MFDSFYIKGIKTSVNTRTNLPYSKVSFINSMLFRKLASALSSPMSCKRINSRKRCISFDRDLSSDVRVVGLMEKYSLKYLNILHNTNWFIKQTMQGK